MQPTKAKTLIPKTSEKSGYSEDICKKVVEFFYEDLQRRLSAMEYKKIVINGFGAFYVKERYMQKYKERYEKIIEYFKNKPDSARKERMTRSLTELIEQFKRVQEQINQDKERKQFFILHKNIVNEQNTGNLAK